MPKLINAVPKYRKHKASGQAIVTLCGRDFYLGPHGSKTSIAEYDRLIAEWLANARRLPREANTPIAMERLLADFWQYAQNYYIGNRGRPTSELDAYKQAMKPLRLLYGKSLVEDFGPLSLKAVREQQKMA